MSFDWNKVLEQLGGKRAGTLNSPAPGTGPTQADSTVAPTTPGFLGGPRIPPTKVQTETGYGGSGDPTPPDASHTVTSAPRPPSIPGTLTPRLNQLYGPLRTEGDSWRFVNQGIASGTWTPVSGAQAAIPVALTQANQRPSKLSQFAGAISAYWVIQYFSFAPVAVTMTGSQSITFQANNADNQVPLGVWTANAGGVIDSTILLDSPFTDATQTAIGNLYVTGNTIATPAVCAWQMGIGIAYLLPDPLFGSWHNDPVLSREALSVPFPSERKRRS